MRICLKEFLMLPVLSLNPLFLRVLFGPLLSADRPQSDADITIFGGDINATPIESAHQPYGMLR